jgi:lipoprotein NlpI
MTNPCPMCGHAETDDRDWQDDMLTAFIAGRRSWTKFSRRENEVFDAYFDLGMNFEEIAQNFGINVYWVKKYFERAMEKVMTYKRDKDRSYWNKKGFSVWKDLKEYQKHEQKIIKEELKKNDGKTRKKRRPD